VFPPGQILFRGTACSGPTSTDRVRHGLPSHADVLGSARSELLEASSDSEETAERGLRAIVGHCANGPSSYPPIRRESELVESALRRATEPIDGEFAIAPEVLADKHPFPAVDVINGRWTFSWSDHRYRDHARDPLLRTVPVEPDRPPKQLGLEVPNVEHPVPWTQV